MFFPGKIEKVRITKDNIGLFSYNDDRTERTDYIKDRQMLEKMMIAYENGIIEKPDYPGRYDLTVLTYDQYKDPYFIIDGCHRIEGMKRMLKDGRLDGFTFWLIPSNFWGALDKEEAYHLNEMVNDELKKNGLPLWVKKFDFTDINGQLVAWKNINIIDTGDINQPLQFGVDWTLNEGRNFIDNKEFKDLPKWRDLVR